MACGILVSQPDIELMPPAMEAQSLNRWTTGEVPSIVFFFFGHCLVAKLCFIASL